jgi:hypothetical protein
MSPVESVAVLLLSLGPESGARILEHFPPALVQSLASTISTFKMIPIPTREKVIADFEEEFEIGKLDRMAQADPKGLADLIRNWLNPSSEEMLDSPRGATCIAFTPRQASAVLMMSLPSEISARIFKALGPDLVNAITLEISLLPAVTAEIRRSLIGEFQKAFQIGHLETEAAADPDAIARCLVRWIGSSDALAAAIEQKFRIECSPRVAGWLKTEPVQARLKSLTTELGASWLRKLPRCKVIPNAQAGEDLVFYWKDRLLTRSAFDLDRLLVWDVADANSQWLDEEDPSLEQARARKQRVEGPNEVLQRCFAAALAELDEELLGPAAHLDFGKLPAHLSGDGLAALAAIRAFHPNLLSHELRSLKSDDLGRVARGLIELMGMAEDPLTDCLKLSVNFTPGELLEKARLSTRPSQHGSVNKVAVLLTLLPNAAPTLQELLTNLDKDNAVRFTDGLARLFYRKEERPLMRQEQLAALGEFAEWQASRNRTEGVGFPSQGASVLKLIPKVWPRMETELNREAMIQLAEERPQSLGQSLARFLKEQSPAPWLPGALRAAHFLNSLDNPERARAELTTLGYALPKVKVDLDRTRQARREWLSRARPVSMN